MPALQPADVPVHLRTLGWDPRPLDDRTWRCTIAHEDGAIRLVVRHAGEWLYLSVLPFFEPATVAPWGHGKYPLGFLGRLLAVNRNLTLVKFALDDDGDLVLRAELPTQSLQPSEVSTGARLLVQTTIDYRSPVREALLDAARSSGAPPAH